MVAYQSIFGDGPIVRILSENWRVIVDVRYCDLDFRLIG